MDDRKIAAMSREEIIEAESLVATAQVPEDLVREFQQFEGIELVRQASRLRPEELGGSDELTVEGFRPDWLAQNFLPRMAPAQISSATLRALAGKPLPMPVLSHLPNQELFDRTYPYSAIGKVFVGTDSRVNHDNWASLATGGGTGAMVGRNVMLTASHITPWREKNWWMYFVPRYFGRLPPYSGFGAPFGGSFVEQYRAVTFPTKEAGGRDIAICKLYRPLGDVTGAFSVGRWYDEDNYKDWPYMSVGYPDNPYLGQRPVIQPFCAIDDVDSDGEGLELETHPFTSSGWSGGPLWFIRNQRPCIVGVCAGTEEDFDFWEFFTKKHSVFSGGKLLVDLVRWAHNNW